MPGSPANSVKSRPTAPGLSRSTPSYLPYVIIITLACWTVTQLVLPRSVRPATAPQPRSGARQAASSVSQTSQSPSHQQFNRSDHKHSAQSTNDSSSNNSGRRSSAAAAASKRVTALAVPMANSQPPVLQRPIALLFGDSLTERSFDAEGGWGAALAHHFARKLDVINRGFGGYNSRWGIKVLEQVLHQVEAQGQQVALLTIWFGANDAAVPGRSAERQHVPVQEYSANLAQMVAAAQAAGIQRILLINPPPIDDEARVKHQQKRMGITDPVPPDRTLNYVQQYAAAVKDLAAKLQLPCVDLYDKLQRTDGWQQRYFDDGVHFTPEGSRRVWDSVREVIQQSFPELSLDQLSNQMPWWDQWDHKTPDEYWSNMLPELQANTAAAAAARAAGDNSTRN